MFELERDRGLMFNALNNAHNATGSVYSIVCIILLAFFLKEKKRIKYLYLFVFLLALVGLLITKSRGSYIGFAAGAVIVLWLFFRSWKKFGITIGAVIAVAIPAVYFSGIYSRIPGFFDFSGGTSGVRLRLWEKAWYLFGQSPIFGVGFARYNDIGYENIRLTGLRQIVSIFIEPKFDFSSGHAHNSYLQFLAETGVVGLGLLLLFWILCYLRILKAYNQTKNDFSRKVFLAGLGIIGGLFALSLTENYFSATTVMMCISVFISLSLGLFWQEKQMAKTKDQRH
jgi:O-antigen ligase